MAFKASNILPANAYNQAKGLCVVVKNSIQVKESQFQSTTNADIVLSFMQDVRTRISELQSYAAVPGIAQYARDQENDQNYDVVTEFSGLLSALQAIVDNIISTFPTDAQGRLLEKTIDVNGDYIFETFSPGQLSTLRGLINSAISSIE